MEIKPIKTNDDYKEALKKLEELFDSSIGTENSDYADILALLVDDYENKHFHIDPPDPIFAIKLRMEELNLKQKDLADIVGSKSRASEILNRQRKLTLDMIRNLTTKLNISPGILIQDYPLSHSSK